MTCIEFDVAVGGPNNESVDLARLNNQLSFWWRVSSEQDFDVLTVYVDDVAAETISGELGWTGASEVYGQNL
jgi:hypothetical protein